MARTPYTNFHDLNLNWIIEKIKTVFTPDNPPPYPVTSVNQKTGAVELKGTDIPVSANDPQTITNALASKYVKPAYGIPASDLAPGVIPDPASIIDDNAGSQVYDKTWSAHKLFQQEADILDLQNTFSLVAVGSHLIHHLCSVQCQRAVGEHNILLTICCKLPFLLILVCQSTFVGVLMHTHIHPLLRLGIHLIFTHTGNTILLGKHYLTINRWYSTF